ncbi:MAG: hypothetical protein ABWK01_01660 [Infirmifilum sp.]
MDAMKLAVALAGLLLAILAVALLLHPGAPGPRESRGATPQPPAKWESRHAVLASGVLELAGNESSSIPLTYTLPADPERYRNVVVKGRVEANGTVDVAIHPYLRADYVSSLDFNFTPTPRELREGLALTITNKAVKLAEEPLIVQTLRLPPHTAYRCYPGPNQCTPETPQARLPQQGPMAPAMLWVTGRVEEAEGRPFNIYLRDNKGKTYFACTGNSTYLVEFTIPALSYGQVYLLVEPASPEQPELEVRLNLASLRWAPAPVKVAYRVEIYWEELTATPEG